MKHPCISRRVLVMGLMLLTSFATQAEVYRWVDKNGKVNYSDQPPPDVNAEQRKLDNNSIEGVTGNFETKRAAQAAPVVMYVDGICKEVCDQGRDFLIKRKIPFTLRTISSKEQLDALSQQTGSKQLQAPTLQVGKRFIDGFDSGSWGGALDAAGYPKAL